MTLTKNGTNREKQHAHNKVIMAIYFKAKMARIIVTFFDEFEDFYSWR